MPMHELITFYDITGKFKAHVGVEYPDISRTCQELGVGPTGTWPDGSPQYTLPVIYDHSTKTAIAESGAIGRYLDATYPDILCVFPGRIEAPQEATVDAFDKVMAPMPIALQRVNDACKEHFKTRRESWSPLDSAIRAEQWLKLQAGFEQIARWMERRGEEAVCMKCVLGDDSEEQKDVEKWHDRRWARLIAAFEGL
ncbi:hypothetical protein PYCCODRAFT_1445997 [Trametes coccinea BRFM310]|uniref:GST N-terminal domain-containing protein n=1 Tax=Trametes coccinea (strain BRFM310) TaxID=1353009 RepID=A0A1Y2II00_TRAC3|nr:hypothetical protein PYCCODRAFT_1445997 [Trametes coccinea BRFM310]